MSYEDDKKAAVEALAKIDPTQPFGTELFNAIARVSISIPLEAVAIRQNRKTGKIEVFLGWRDENAPAYKNTWALPGTMMRPFEPEEKGLERLFQREFGCPVDVIKRLGWDDNPHEERGHCVHHVFLVSPEGESAKGRWFPVDELPPEIIDHHREQLIPMAALEYISLEQ